MAVNLKSVRTVPESILLQGGNVTAIFRAKPTRAPKVRALYKVSGPYIFEKTGTNARAREFNNKSRTAFKDYSLKLAIRRKRGAAGQTRGITLTVTVWEKGARNAAQTKGCRITVLAMGARRAAMGLSKSALARRAGLNRSTVRRAEAGKPVKAATLAALMKQLS